MQFIKKIKQIILFAAIAMVAFLFYNVRTTIKDGKAFSFQFSRQKEIDLTPIQIESIQNIGQWEFLSINDEELVDTTRRHLLIRNDRLVRIYKGILRIGIDFAECGTDWAMGNGEKAVLNLPAIKLLDSRFIDEARTESFFEEGEWDAETKEQMYQRAQERMLSRNLTPENINKAEENARVQIEALFRSLGYSDIDITISRTSLQP